MTGNKNKKKSLNKGMAAIKNPKSQIAAYRPTANERRSSREDDRHHYSSDRRRYNRYSRRSRSDSRSRTFSTFNGKEGEAYMSQNDYSHHPEGNSFNNRSHYSPPPRDEQAPLHYVEEGNYAPRYESPRRSPVHFEPPPDRPSEDRGLRWQERRGQADHENVELRSRSPRPPETPNSIPNFVSQDEGHPMVPTFDGEDPNLTSRQWVRIVEEIGQAENWTCHEKRFQMISKFVGAPKEWLLKEDIFADNWNRWKRAFIRAFPFDMDYHMQLQRMISRTKLDTETYSNYFTFKSMLLKACNITGRKAISCLIGGLVNEPLKNLAYDQNFDTPEALYNFLMQQEQFRNIRTQEPQKETIVKMCNICNMSGHLNNECPEKSNVEHETIPINPKCFIDVRINGHCMQAYNDMHSHYVTIREDQATNMHIRYKYQAKIICGYKGSAVTSVGEITITIRVGNVSVNTEAYIVPSNAQDFLVILGDNLRRHPEVIYQEEPSCITFEPAASLVERNSFAMNEELVKNLNDHPSKRKCHRKHYHGKSDKHPRHTSGQFQQQQFSHAGSSRSYRFD